MGQGLTHSRSNDVNHKSMEASFYFCMFIYFFHDKDREKERWRGEREREERGTPHRVLIPQSTPSLIQSRSWAYMVREVLRCKPGYFPHGFSITEHCVITVPPFGSAFSFCLLFFFPYLSSTSVLSSPSYCIIQEKQSMLKR